MKNFPLYTPTKIVFGKEVETETGRLVFRALDMPVSIGGLPIGVQPDEVLKKMTESATKRDTIKLGCFKQLDVQDMYEVYKKENR